MSGLRSRLVLALAVGSVVGSVGCRGNEDQTCEVPTEEISVVALVVDSGLDIRATIDFERGDRRGTGAPLELCDLSDVLTINGQSTEEIVKASRIEHSISLPADAARTVRFLLERQSFGDQIDLQIELPPAFEVLAPMDGDGVALQAQPAVEWEPAQADGTMRVRLIEPLGGGQCVQSTVEGEVPPYKEAAGVQTPDVGTHTIEGMRLASPEPCDVTLELARVVLGDYPASLNSGGRVEARVERRVDVQAVP